MSAYLVERDATAYVRLAGVPARYPDISVKTYNADFLGVLPAILKDIPSRDTFAFFLLDPKGWRIPLKNLSALLARPNSEIIFNFMFEFINRAASIKDPSIISGLEELIPFGDWRNKLQIAEQTGTDTPEKRKAILVEAFSASLKALGNYEYVAETTVLRPLKNRPLYCLFYATRNPIGIEVFRDCQVNALRTESTMRAAAKVKHAATSTGQGEIFESLHDMAPDKLEEFLQHEGADAERSLFELAPSKPHFLVYEKLRAQVLARHVVRSPDVNAIAAALRKQNKLSFPDWEKNKRVPQRGYRTQRI